MIKEWLALAALGAAIGWKPRVITGGRQPATIDVRAIELQPPAPKAASIIAVMPADAVAAFGAYMRDEWAGNWFRLTDVMAMYADLAGQHGWPPVTRKYLSQQLVNCHGCKRAKLDRRASGDGRPTYIRFPADRRRAA